MAIAYPEMAIRMFGKDSLIGDNLPHPEVSRFLRRVTSLSFNRYRKVIRGRIAAVNGLQAKVDASFAGKYSPLTFDNQPSHSRVSALQKGDCAPVLIRAYLRDTQNLLTKLSLFKDKSRKARCAEYKEQLDEMQSTVLKRGAAILNSSTSSINAGSCRTNSAAELPPMLRDALTQLPTADDVDSVLQAIDDSLAATDEEQNEAVLPTPVDEITWAEGTEKSSECATEVVNQLIGLGLDGVIPGFNLKVDPYGLTTPWTAEGRAVLDSEQARMLLLHWHQKVGLLRMLENLLQAMPILLMDEVGVGKTAQGLALIAMYVMYHAYHEKPENQGFPGMFGTFSLPSRACHPPHLETIANAKFPGGPGGNLPDRPHIIVAPVGLIQQWMTEIQRFIKPRWFSFVPYTGSFTSQGRAEHWRIWNSLVDSPMHQRILLVSIAVSTTALFFLPRTGTDIRAGIEIGCAAILQGSE